MTQPSITDLSLYQSPVIFEQNAVISPTFCGRDSLLSYHAAFNLFMDIAAGHADHEGVGNFDMAKKHLFWVTVKTRLRFYERPRMGDHVTLRTWPEKPRHVQADRSYQMVRDNRLLVCGKTEWALINLATGRPGSMEDVYDASIVAPCPPALPGPYARVRGTFDTADTEDFPFIVPSTAIDAGGHMNNAVYLRAMMSTFTVKQLTQMPIREINAFYRSQCYEKDHLHIQRQKEEDGYEFRFMKEEADGTLSGPLFQAKITLGGETEA